MVIRVEGRDKVSVQVRVPVGSSFLKFNFCINSGDGVWFL